jgi:hypothetical protein
MTTKQAGSSDLQRPVPIPPLSVVSLAYSDRETPSWQNQEGRVFRIGYYSRTDGLDCIWLVNDKGKYEQTIDHESLYRYFDVIHFADHTNWYGRRRPKIPPIRLADRRVIRRKK